jgi:capsule polysaccharide export protein KpsE/RkpR
MGLFNYSIDLANKIRDDLIENSAYRFYKNRLSEVIIYLIRDGMSDLKKLNSENFEKSANEAIERHLVDPDYNQLNDRQKSLYIDYLKISFNVIADYDNYLISRGDYGYWNGFYQHFFPLIQNDTDLERLFEDVQGRLREVGLS